MRYLAGFFLACALVVPFAGCGEDQRLPTCVGFADGTPCLNSTGTCFDGNCEVACAEQGLITAVAAGGGPYTFACDGPQTVVTSAEVVIEKYIILDGRGDLTLDGDGDHRVFRVNERAVATLSGMTITRGFVEGGNGGAIAVGGTLTLEGVTVSGSTASNTGGFIRGHGGGIYNTGTLTLSNSTVSDNDAAGLIGCTPLGASDDLCLFDDDGLGGGIDNEGGTVTLMNSTVDSNMATIGGGAIANRDNGTLTLINSTVSGNRSRRGSGGGIANIAGNVLLRNGTIAWNRARIAGGLSGTQTVVHSVVAGNLAMLEGDNCTKAMVSGGENIESPGDSCGFGDSTDGVDVAASDLKLSPLRDNGGPTRTHALLTGSVAVDAISECLLPQDQRGVARPQGAACDLGAFESLCLEGACDDDGNECTTDCDAATGACENSNVEDGTLCSGGICVEGACRVLQNQCSDDELGAIEAGEEPDADALTDCAFQAAPGPECVESITECLQGSETSLSESCSSCFAFEACCSMNQPDCQAAFDTCLGAS
jgi:hypothetical protein